jgi:hypothetical protein
MSDNGTPITDHRERKDQFRTEVGVPVFRPHKRADYEVTAADLHEIAANSNRSTAVLHGGKVPHNEGHRSFDPKFDEKLQPDTFGYCDNFRVSTLSDGVPAIICDRHILTDKFEQAAKHPYPSVEYQAATKTIIGVARLTRPPFLNLGAVFYNEGHPIYVYSMEPTVSDMPNDKTKPQDTPGTLTPEEIVGAEKLYGYLKTKYSWVAKCEAQFGENAKTEPKTDDKTKPKEDDSVKAYAAELAATKTEVERLRKEAAAEKIGRTLDGLVVEGYQFDRSAEETTMLALDETGRKGRVEAIKKFHHRNPTPTGLINVYSGNVEGPNGPADQDTVRKAQTYQAEHKVDFGTALEAVKQGKK